MTSDRDIFELIKALGYKLNNIKTKALKMNPLKPPKVAPGYKLKPLPSKPKYGLAVSNTSKIPGSGPSNNKSPVKMAQQIKNPDVKSDAMKQAKSMSKSGAVTFSKNGQWKLS